MPVITHRRATELRSGRRRLSIGIIGNGSAQTNTRAQTPSTTSPTTAASATAAARASISTDDQHNLGDLAILRERRKTASERRGSLARPRSESLSDAQCITRTPRRAVGLRLYRTNSGSSDSSLDSSPESPTTASSSFPRTGSVEPVTSPAVLECRAQASASCAGQCGSEGEAVVDTIRRQRRGVLETPLFVSASSQALAPGPSGESTPMLAEIEAAGCQETDDEEFRTDPLPSTEHLIMTQSWSTWPVPCHDLYSNSEFKGRQSNGTRSYNVVVSLKYVDMGVPELCGHFTIYGLTPDLPKLTTFFDAQIVGTGGHSFVTKDWDASADTDRTHWSFFPSFRQYRNTFDCSDFKYRLEPTDKYVFMRWKERFVVPNYKLNRINGASYDGFYYVCYDREEATIIGYYYHKESEQYQCLKLEHQKQNTFAHFELA